MTQKRQIHPAHTILINLLAITSGISESKNRPELDVTDSVREKNAADSHAKVGEKFEADRLFFHAREKNPNV